MDFRVGVHMGDVRVEGGRIYGDGVNIAARLEALADAGGICISSTVHDQVRHRISVDFEDLGEKSVKNIPDPVRVYRALLFAAERAEAPAAGVAALLIWGTGGEFGSTARARFDDRGGHLGLQRRPLDNLSGEAEQEFFEVDADAHEPPRRPTLRGPPAPHGRAEGRRQALTAVPARRAA